MEFVGVHRFLLGVLDPLCVFGHVALAVGPLLGLGIGSRVFDGPSPCCDPLSSSEGTSRVFFQQVLVEASSVFLDEVVDFLRCRVNVDLLVFLDVPPDDLVSRL